MLFRSNSRGKKSVGASWRQIVSLPPILFAIKVEPITVLEILLFIWLSGLFSTSLKFFRGTILRNPLVGFSFFLSVITLIRVLSLTFSIQRIMLIILVGIVMVGALYGVGYRNSHSNQEAIVNKEDCWSPLSKSLLIVGSLCCMGWVSLFPYLISILAALAISKRQHKRIRLGFTTVVCGAGMISSYFIEPRFPGQYWTSFDQLFRAGIGNGLVSWGFHENVGAVGHHLNYHWLSEAVAGFIAKSTHSSVVDSTNKILPLIGVVLAVELFEFLATRYKIQKNVGRTATLIALIAFNQFDLYSIGSLWGIGLFLIGIVALVQLWDNLQLGKPLSGLLAVTLLLFPLIMVSQATLGINFLLLAIFVLILATVRFDGARSQLLTLLLWLGVITIALRISILAGPKDFYQQPSISLKNVLAFKGTDTYFGDNRILIVLSSVLYLMGMLQMLGGLFLIERSRRVHREVLVGLTVLFITCLILANLF